MRKRIILYSITLISLLFFLPLYSSTHFIDKDSYWVGVSEKKDEFVNLIVRVKDKKVIMTLNGKSTKSSMVQKYQGQNNIFIVGNSEGVFVFIVLNENTMVMKQYMGKDENDKSIWSKEMYFVAILPPEYYQGE